MANREGKHITPSFKFSTIAWWRESMHYTTRAGRLNHPCFHWDRLKEYSWWRVLCGLYKHTGIVMILEPLLLQCNIHWVYQTHSSTRGARECAQISPWKITPSNPTFQKYYCPRPFPHPHPNVSKIITNLPKLGIVVVQVIMLFCSHHNIANLVNKFSNATTMYYLHQLHNR